MCVYGHMTKKSRVGRSALIFIIFIFITIGKTGNSRSRFRNPIFHFSKFVQISLISRHYKVNFIYLCLERTYLFFIAEEVAS